MYKDEKKLKHNNIIKNWSLNSGDLKTSKFKTLNISFVAFLWSNRGATITDDPFRKNKNKTIFGNINHKIIIKKEINT